MGLKEAIRRLREFNGWTQSKAAAAAGVPLRTFQNWEAGVRDPQPDGLVKLADAFGVTLDELFERKLPKTKSPRNRR
jgi:transcriptional regulator with XRE-family HTH domain